MTWAGCIRQAGLGVFVLAAMVGTAGAATRTWTDSSVYWTNAASWTLAVVPGAGDIAAFPTDNQVNNQPYIDDTRSVSGMTFNASGTTNRYRLGGPGRLQVGPAGVALVNGGTGLKRCDLNIDVELTAPAEPWSIASGTMYAGPEHFRITHPIGGEGGLAKTGGAAFSTTGTLLVYTNTSHRFAGGTRIDGGMVCFDLGVQTSAAAYRFGTGPITLNGGVLEFRAYGTNAPASGNTYALQVLNPVGVTADGGALSGWPGGPSAADQPIPIFAGDITLGGRLEIGTGGYNYSYQNNATRYTGTVTLTQTVARTLAITTGVNYYCQDGRLLGNIVDGAGRFRNPLLLGHWTSLVLIGGATNTYRGGTVVGFTANLFHGDPQRAIVDVAASSSLGTGDLTIQPGGRIRLNGANNLAAGARVAMHDNGVARAVLGLGFDAGRRPPLTVDSAGILALEASSAFNAITNLSELGNGTMYLGCYASHTFSGARLAAGAGNAYRLGGGSSSGLATLTISGNVLVDRGATTNRLQVGQTGWHSRGVVYLQGSNTFSGTITVMGEPRYDNGPSFSRDNAGCRLQGDTRAAGSSLGSTNADVMLIGSGVLAYGTAGGNNKPLRKHTLAFQGLSHVNSDDNAYQTDFLFDSVARTNRGVLYIRGWNNHLGGKERIKVAALSEAGSLINGILPPCFTHWTTADFMTYRDAVGFTNFPASSYAAMPPAPGAGTEVVATNAITIADARTIYALKATGPISGSGTIHILSGGLMLSAQTVQPNINFGNAEGVVLRGGTLSGTISGSNGVTAAEGTLNLTGVNTFQGPVTLNGGTVSARWDTLSPAAGGGFGNTNNPIVMNGGWLQRNAAGGNGLLASRTITLGPLGGLIGPTSAVTIYSRITGAGYLMVPDSGLTVANGSNDYSGGTRIWNNLTVTPTGKLGTGPVVMERAYTLTLLGNGNIDSGASLQASAYSTVSFQCPAPRIGSLLGAGQIKLGAAGTNTVLTVGLDSGDAVFCGRIYQQTGQTGGVIKDGTGTWTLYGGQIFTGATVVTNGTLALMGSLAGDLTVGPNGTLSGIGSVGGHLVLHGTWRIALTSDTVYDSLQVAGNTSLGGALEVTLAAGYKPRAGTTWTVLDGATYSGSFSGTTHGFIARRVGAKLVLSNPAGATSLLVR